MKNDAAQLGELEGGLSDAEMRKFMQFYLRMESEKRFLEGKRGNGGGSQYQNLSNVNIFNISNSAYVGNLLSDPTVSSSIPAEGMRVFSSANKHGDT